MRSRTENAVTPSETPIPSVKYVFIVEPKVGGGSSYICCCCCCGRSGGGGAAYFAGGGGGTAGGGAGAGGRGGWPPAKVRQAVRRAAVVRTDGAACRAATRPCRSRVRLPLASMLQPWFGPLRPHACDFLPVQPGSRFLESSECTNQFLRPPPLQNRLQSRDGLACVDILASQPLDNRLISQVSLLKITHSKGRKHYCPARPVLVQKEARRATHCLA